MKVTDQFFVNSLNKQVISGSTQTIHPDDGQQITLHEGAIFDKNSSTGLENYNGPGAKHNANEHKTGFMKESQTADSQIIQLNKETKRLKMMTTEFRGNLRRSEQQINRIISSSVHDQTQCIKKQSKFYNQLSGQNKVQKQQYKDESAWTGESEISVFVNKRASQNVITPDATSVRFQKRIDYQNLAKNKFILDTSRLKTQQGTTRGNLFSCNNEQISDIILDQRKLSQIQVDSRNDNFVHSFEADFNKQEIQIPFSSFSAIGSTRNKRKIYNTSNLNEKDQRNRSLCKLHRTRQSILQSSQSPSKHETRQKSQFHNYSLQKLDLNPQPSNYRKIKSRGLEFQNYIGYTQSSIIKPVLQNLEQLQKMEPASKIQILLGKKFTDHNQTNTKTQEEARQDNDQINETPSYFQHLSRQRKLNNSFDGTVGAQSRNWLLRNSQTPLNEQDDGHRQRKIQTQKLETQLQNLQLRLKEKRRLNLNVFQKLQSERAQLHKLKAKSDLALKVHTENGADQTQIQRKQFHLQNCHGLYSQLIKANLQTSVENTKYLSAKAKESLLKIQDEMKVLKNQKTELLSHLKYCVQAIQSEQETLSEQHKKLMKDLENGINQDSKSQLASDILSNQESQTQTNAESLAHTQHRLRSDFNKVEKISRQVNLMMQSKRPIDSIFCIINSCQEAFGSLCKHVTLFIFDPTLRHYIEHFGCSSKFSKEVQCEGAPQNGQILAIFLNHDTYCAPQFTEIEQASNLIHTSQFICVPSKSANKLIFVLQIEADIVRKSSLAKAYSKNQDARQKFISSEENSHHLKKQQSDFSMSHENKKSESYIHRSHLKGFKKSDTVIAQLIAKFGSAKLEIFSETMKTMDLENCQLSTVKFVKDFMNFKNNKQVLKAVKHDLPNLLGFQKASIFLLDEVQRNLYAVSIHDDKVNLDCDQGSFEGDFVFQEDQIVRFPYSMGMSGFAYMNNAVMYFNNQNISLTDSQKTFGSVYRIGNKTVPLLNQAFIGQTLATEYPFNQKIDNFLDINMIQNAIVSSISDEENIGTVQCVGTLNLYNKSNFCEISQEDLARVSYIGKLIGSILKNCRYYSTTLQIVLGLRLMENKLISTRENADAAGMIFLEGSVYSINHGIRQIQRQLDNISCSN